MGRADARLGTVVADRYRIDRVLGVGGMGVVYAGIHTWTERAVAIKILRPEFAQQTELLQRFFQEAKTAAGLRHPNVVDVLDMGMDDDDSAFIVLELLEGESLETRLKREGELDPAQTLRILLPVIEALHVAHARGIIHRDLKPANLFLVEDRHGEEVPKLLDFGIAKLLENSVIQTQTGSMLGTPGYMSPEQMRGVSDLTAASDVWGMGVMLFRTLAGRLPFDVDPNPTTMVMNILMNEAPRLREIAPDVPPNLAAAVDLALKHSPETRHRDMQELLEALLEGAQLDGIPVVDPVQSLPPGVI